MLKVIFHRNSPVVRLLEAFGVGIFLFLGKETVRHGGLRAAFFLFLVAGYLVVRLCDGIRWYPGRPCETGIRLHFRKALVPTSYLLFCASLFLLLDLPVVSVAVLALASLLMTVIVAVNGILIYFHLIDNEPLPVNFFSKRQDQTSVA